VAGGRRPRRSAIAMVVPLARAAGACRWPAPVP